MAIVLPIQHALEERHTRKQRGGGGKIKGFATDLKVGGPIFFGPPHILQGPPPLFGGGHSKMWGVLKSFFTQQCSLQRSCTVLWSEDIPLLEYTRKKINNLCVVWISIIGIHKEEIDLCLVDSRTNI